MAKSSVGIIGMGVMGKNLALNIANHGYFVSVFNRSDSETMKQLFQKSIDRLFPYLSIKEFIYSLKKPRCVLLMIQSGTPIDIMIETILPFLQEGDIIVDGGNSFYKDTIKRFNFLKKKQIQFLGVGISGGEEGALTGPAIMPGGDKKAYQIISPILKTISAKYNQEACVKYIGPNGSGHYVKMVHNGIEYSDMQLISEAYFLLKHIAGMGNIELSNTFDKWNQGELSSYLIEITGNILRKKDIENNFIIDYILDSASSKGTGLWTAKSALDLNVPCSVITESVFLRYLSSLKANRMIASTILSGPLVNKIKNFNKIVFVEDIRKALYLGKIISYAQGFSLMKRASEYYDWNLNFSNISKIFRAGCIIRADFLNEIVQAYSSNNNIIDLLFAPQFKDIINVYQISLRNIVITAIGCGIAVPLFSSVLSYYDSYRTIDSPANLIQAQRDYFGAHTYERIDKIGSFHTNWIDY
ncbi:decarboxylating NADP(+)-dependent phosphogluconate dehydrogenase [Buchnera aphidicola]|uniref:6-phosphogluconate dehydrogenase, decarboxylating n=1 Tax=Buchnera aphidicola (Cinara strobi) TaxID=1921549 RepID=A0A3B1E9C7_9GAMM|nr:decarboxylating NADP(+)-dependent phosphogluconate dehydrogenase [Buchnera aphidicola]VAX76319.1 6-phosphogluconate dehydrogenase, decarboxylating [Buchnera aphidicola (Cinara strobi)]